MAQAPRDRESQGQGNGGPRDGQERSMHLIDLTFRSWGQVYDLQMSAARMLLRTQSRAVSAMGFPDWGGLFDGADERARYLFSTGAAQWFSSARRANDAMVELQREVGRLLDTETATLAQMLQQDLTRFGDRASQGFTELVEKVREGADEAERIASAANQDLHGEDSGEEPQEDQGEQNQRRRGRREAA